MCHLFRVCLDKNRDVLEINEKHHRNLQDIDAGVPGVITLSILSWGSGISVKKGSTIPSHDCRTFTVCWYLSWWLFYVALGEICRKGPGGHISLQVSLQGFPQPWLFFIFSSRPRAFEAASLVPTAANFIHSVKVFHGNIKQPQRLFVAMIAFEESAFPSNVVIWRDMTQRRVPTMVFFFSAPN